VRISSLLRTAIVLFIGAVIWLIPAINTSCKESETVDSDTLFFWNLHDTVNYVGMTECISCHHEIHSSFIHTGMGKSFGLASKEKSSALFPFNHTSMGEQRGLVVSDTNSGLNYQAFWRNDSLFIREFFTDKDQRNLITYHRVEHIPYIIGSGQHTNSHFWSDGDYLYQAPLTYYTQKGIWDLPPGYKENNIGFSRKIDVECMSCHNAMPKVSQQAKNLFEEIPLGINCERCHGPGEMHVNLKKKGILVDTSKYADRSIVNPKRLPYQRQVDICQRCHLQGNNVLKEGKSFTDFRPGMKLSDVFEIYMPKYENEDYFVMAGHAERFQKSECFIHSNPKNTEKYNPKINFTCINCHNPHISVNATQSEIFNNTCINCHQEGSVKSKYTGCSIKENTNNCVSCHMPASSAEDIPHVMVHDHKIQRPTSKSIDIESTKGKLLGLYAVNNPNPSNKSLVKAYLSYFEKFNPNPLFLKKADELLRDESNREGEIHLYYIKGEFTEITKIAKNISANSCDEWTAYRIAKSLDRTGQLNQSISWYKRCFDLKPLDLDFTAEYSNALIRLKRTEEAKVILKKQYNRARKHPLTLLNLGSIYFLEKEYAKAKQMFQKTLALNPRDKRAHLYLAELYELVGELKLRDYHLEKSR